jgi:hypothetical protein|tara:strand:- start:2342 stop:2650 length:309 start_codon:yes stop_codon:yes gene_type:complete
MWMIGCIAVLGVLIIAAGHIISIMWGWFIVPLGVPEVTAPWGYAVYALVRYMTTPPATVIQVQDLHRQIVPSNKQRYYTMLFAEGLILSLILLIGYICKEIM